MITSDSHFKYAEALLRVALRSNVDEQVLHDLGMLNEGFKDANFRLKLREISFLKKADQEKVLRNAFDGNVGKLTVNLLILLSAAKKTTLLPKIYKAYGALQHQKKGIGQVIIRTARPLSENEKSTLIERLIQKRDKKVSVEFETDAKLIGGAQVYEKGFMTDYSVKNYLEVLKKSLLA